MMKRLLACLLCLMLLGACAFSSASAVESEAPGRVQAMLDRLLAFQLERTGSKDVQEWISGELARNAGAGSEWNIFALSQMGEYDFSGYCTALNAYLNGAGSISHATRQKYALAMLSAGGKQAFVEETAKQTVGAQGIMTWVYGLHLLNNGVEGSVTPVQAVDHILQLQLPDGGWALRGGCIRRGRNGHDAAGACSPCFEGGGKHPPGC